MEIVTLLPAVSSNSYNLVLDFAKKKLNKKRTKNKTLQHYNCTGKFLDFVSITRLLFRLVEFCLLPYLFASVDFNYTYE